jgi:type I restriction enzyme, S subunit
MSSESWRETTFADLIFEGAIEIGDGYRAKNSELGGDGPLFLRSGRVSDGRIDFSGHEHLATALVPSLKGKLGRSGDTVVTTKGNSTGVVAFVGRTSPPFVYSPHLSYWRARDESVVVPGFLRYWARSDRFRAQLHAMAASTDMAPYLSLADQKRLLIALPPVDQQRRIAGVLWALDDKIEHNRTFSEYLDAFVEVNFRSSKFVLSDDGELPPGWRRVTVGDVAEINARSLTARSHPDEVEYIDISNTAPRAIAMTTRLAWANAPSRARRVVRAGDTLISTVRPERRSMVFVPETREGLTASTGFAVVTPTKVSPTLVSRVVTSDECIRHLSAAATGSAYPAVNPRLIEEWAFALPPDGGAEFERVAGPAERLRWRLLEECRSLASLRDELLPKLVSGQVRVSDSYVRNDLLGTAAEVAGAAV